MGCGSSKKTQREEPAGDFMEVGKEVVPGMRLRCICRGHQGTIGRIAWSPCGRFIASPSSDKTIRIWDANDGRCLAVLEGHKGAVHCVAWSDSGDRIATGGVDGTVRVLTLSGCEDGFEQSDVETVLVVPNDSVSFYDVLRISHHGSKQEEPITPYIWKVDDDQGGSRNSPSRV